MASKDRAFLFRIAPNKVNKTDAALRRNRIYIGWKAPGLLDRNLSKPEFKAIVAESFPDYKRERLGKAAANLWRFIREMRNGDLLIVAPMDKRRQVFYLAQVAGPPRLYGGDDPDIAFERRVEWLNDKRAYLRSEASRALNEVLKNRPTSRLLYEEYILKELRKLVGCLWYPDDLDESQSYPQAAKKQVVVNKYERDRKAREACIKIHGLRCVVCGFDFQEQYGEAGKGLIHVHHTTPVSQLDEGYRVNPRTDLCPVCPNCHAIMHPSRRRTLTIKAAKRLVLRPFPW